MRILPAAVLLLLVCSASAVDLAGPSAEVRISSRNGRTRVDRTGVWNIWPDYTAISIGEVKLDGKPVEFDFAYAPADTSIAWLDGHLFSLAANTGGDAVVRVDVVRRGRFRLHYAGKRALSRPVDWSCSLMEDTRAVRKLTVRLADGSAALLCEGKLLLKLDGGGTPEGVFTAALGSFGEDRGALGWYSSFEQRRAENSFPAPLPVPGNEDRVKRVMALEEFLVDPDMDALPFQPGRVRYYDARLAAARIALDGLWFRLNRGKDEPGFEFFLTELEKLAAEIKSGGKADFTISVPQAAPGNFFLAADDPEFYFGFCGWGLGAYAPELARMGINLVAEHIWPNAVTDGNGKPRDGMIVRRTMPQQEEFEKYNIAFDLMIAPYTPGYLLGKHPEWDGVFIGLGMENELENLTRHAKEWQGRQAGHGFLKASVISPDYREMCRNFLAFLLPYFRGSKALVAIDLANEVQLEDYSPAMQQRFREFLKRKYSAVGNLNAAWNSKYDSFDDVLMVRPMVFERAPAARYRDWVLCNREAGTEHFRYLKELCAEYAPGIPAHIKFLPHEFGAFWYEPGSNARNFYDYADGIDRKALTELTEIAGTDSWADNASDAAGRLSSDVPLQSMYFSLLRSYAPQKWIFDSEWHIVRCDPPATPPDCLDMVMRQNAAQGLRAGAFWVLAPGNGQHLEIGSSARLLLQSGITAAQIRSERELYNAIASRPRRFGVLYSPKSRQVGGDGHAKALAAFYEAGMFSGVEIRMVDERQLIEGSVTKKDLDVLAVIECPFPAEETFSALRNFTADGGKLILYGDFGSMVPGMEQPGFLKREPLETNHLKLVERIRADARRYGCFPAVDVTGGAGKSVYGVEWHSAALPDGRNVLYIVNMSRKKQTLRAGSKVISLEDRGTYIGVGE